MSEDPIIGITKKIESFWKRVVAYYHTNQYNGAEKRIADKSKTHWASVKMIVNNIIKSTINGTSIGQADEVTRI